MNTIFSDVEHLRENMFTVFKNGQPTLEQYYAYNLPRSLVEHVFLACAIVFKEPTAVHFWINHRSAPLKKKHLERELDILEANSTANWAWFVESLQTLNDPTLETTLDDLNSLTHD
jgi:hypothetical protein